MRYIDEDKIYQETDGGKDIFRYYYRDYDFGKRPPMKIKVRDEKTASAQITYYQGYWRITDFGNQNEVNSLKGVAFVMYMENLNYYEALKFVEEVIIRHEVGGSGWQKPSWRPGYEMREMTPEDVKGRYNFVYKEEGEITQKDLEAFGRYVTKEMLQDFNCRVLKEYEYCSFSEKHKRDVVHKFIATEDYPMFVFDYGEFQKIYRPHDLEKKNRFLYAGRKPKNYVYGLQQLLNAKNELVSNDEDDDETSAPSEKPNARLKDIFRCSGESDALNLYSLGFHVYWLNSETAELTYDEYKEIDDLCVNHYQIMDLDATGRAMALKNAVRYIDLLTIELPEWLGAKKDFRGNPCKDLKDFINLIGESEEETRKQFIYRKAKARKVKFWSRSEKGEYSINMEFFYFFLKANGFYQMEYRHMKNIDYCYAWIKGKVVDLIPPDGIKRIVKRFTKDWIKSKNLTDEIAILNKLNTSNQISEANIDTMDNVEIEFRNVSKEYEYLHFKNASLRISKTAIERIKHEQVPNHILGAITIKNEVISHVIPRNISLQDRQPVEVNATPAYQALLDRQAAAASVAERETVAAEIALMPEIDRYDVKFREGFIFTDFLRDITRMHWRKEQEEGVELTETERREEMLALANVMFCLGYLAAQYKNQGKPWIVFLQDTKISEIGKSSGRSGKSLVSQALKYVRQHFYIEGRNLDDKNQFQFIYDGLTEFHDVIEVDDLAEFGNFTFFYTQTTGNRTVNSKHTSPFVLNYEDSGKMIISSNFELPNTDSSTMARLLNCGVSDYYHEMTKFNDYKETRSPLSKFGRQLYTDFTEDEWIEFYNFIAYCIQLQMRFDKIQPPMENLERRQLRREMSEGLGREENFLKWADDYFQVWDSATGPRPAKSPAESDCAYFDTFFSRGTAFLHFMENSGISENKKKAYNAQRFKTHLTAWAKYHGFTLNPERVANSKDGRIMQKIDGKVVEMFYISTRPGDLDTQDIPDVNAPAPDVPNLPF